jgi:hypothetical protein
MNSNKFMYCVLDTKVVVFSPIIPNEIMKMTKREDKLVLYKFNDPSN